MIEPTPQKLIDIQISVIQDSTEEEDEGLAGVVREMGTIDFITDKRNWKNNIFEHAAWLLFSIATMHPFYQGNKRTATAVAMNVLRHKNLIISASPKESEAFILDVASYNRELNDVEKWLIENSEIVK